MDGKAGPVKEILGGSVDGSGGNHRFVAKVTKYATEVKQEQGATNALLRAQLNLPIRDETVGATGVSQPNPPISRGLILSRCCGERDRGIRVAKPPSRQNGSVPLLGRLVVPKQVHGWGTRSCLTSVATGYGATKR